jgi:PAS domain S-box-containing protein
MGKQQITSTTQIAPNIEVGFGTAFDNDSFEAGRKAATKAISDILSLPASAVTVFASPNYQLDDVLSGIRSIVNDTPLFFPESTREIFSITSSRSVIVMAFASPFPKTVTSSEKQTEEESLSASRQRIENELAEQVHFLQTLIDNTPNPVFYKDTYCNYLGCNKAFEEYLEVRREEIVGKPVKNIKTSDRIELHQKMDEYLIKNVGKVAYESMNRPKHGNAHHDVTHKALFQKADGSICGIIATVTDIFDLKNTEEALRASEENF